MKNPANLSKNEMSALKQLSDTNQIVIKPSDKGGNVVLLGNEKYINMYLPFIHIQKSARTIKILLEDLSYPG